MQKIIGVTDLQRRFRDVLEEVLGRHQLSGAASGDGIQDGPVRCLTITIALSTCHRRCMWHSAERSASLYGHPPTSRFPS